MYNKKFYRDSHPSLPWKFQLKLVNDTYYVASYLNGHKMPGTYSSAHDHRGAFMYVVAVIMLWGLSIVLLIASTIRKNRMDKNISLYLKEIQAVRNLSDRQKILQVVVNMENANGDLNLSQEEQPSRFKKTLLPVTGSVSRNARAVVQCTREGLRKMRGGRKIFLSMRYLQGSSEGQTRRCSLAVPEIFVEDETGDKEDVHVV